MSQVKLMKARVSNNGIAWMAHLATHKLISFWDALLSHTESPFKNS